MFLQFSIRTKVRAGISIALLGSIATLGNAAFSHFSFFQRAFPCMSATFVALGCLSSVAGWFGRRKPGDLTGNEAATVEPTAFDHPLSFLRSFSYWGGILLASGGVLFSLNASHLPPPQGPIAAIPIARRPVKAPVIFPQLELQGLVFSGPRSSALINGKVLCIGEGIGPVKVVAIEYDHVEVELAGETNSLYLPE
jgi:hypothetical protein